MVRVEPIEIHGWKVRVKPKPFELAPCKCGFGIRFPTRIGVTLTLALVRVIVRSVVAHRIQKLLILPDCDFCRIDIKRGDVQLPVLLK
jgi:hypothetical protein